MGNNIIILITYRCYAYNLILYEFLFVTSFWFALENV